MSTVNDEPLVDREEGRRLYEEADKLLRLAEELQDKCEQYERRLWMLVAICLMMTVFAAAGASLAIALPKDSFYRTLLTPGGILVAIAPFYLYYVIARTSGPLRRERRALHSIVDMLRGLEKGIAEKNNLSTLERAEFRIRLSRLDIGPGQQG